MNERRDWAPVDWSPMKRLIYLRGNPATGGGGSPLTVSGATPLLMPGAVSKPMRKATFAISPVQAGTGDPSPSNVRAITGWTGANVTVSGRNLTNLIEDGKAPSTTSGQLVPASGCRTDFIKVTPGATYTISAETATNNYVYWFNYTADKQFINYGNTQQGTSIVKPINAHSNAAYIMLRTTVGLAGVTSLQFEPGSTATPYTPYSGSSLSVEFPASVGTVYSGTIDPVTGEGVVTHKCVNFKDCVNSLYRVIRNNADTGTIYRMYEPLDDEPVAGNIDALCDRLKLKKGANAYMEPYTFKVNNQAFWVCLPDDDIQDAEAWINANEPHVVYELATPIPFSITPQPLTPPAGDAYIWADCGGSAEVTYIGKA